MATPEPQTAPVRPRAVALVGPYGSGKSSLWEAMLAAAGCAVRRTPARTHKAGTEPRLAHCAYLGDHWSILDCPGSIEFAFETDAALAVADIAVVVCEPAPERAAAIAPLLRALHEQAIPHLLFINKMDACAYEVSEVMAALQGVSPRPLVLRHLPLRDGEHVSGYVDLVSERAYRYQKGKASELIALPVDEQAHEQRARAGLLEQLADHDDALLEQLLEDIVPERAEIYRQLRQDQTKGVIAEVLLGAAEQDGGVRRLWKTLRHDTPEVTETARRRGIEPDGPPLAQVFRTVHAPHVGKLSHARVWRGALRDGGSLAGGRVSGIYRAPSGDLAKVSVASAGEIVALGKLEGAATGDTLAASGGPARLDFPHAPPPVFALAIAAGDRSDDVKLSGALTKLQEEDRGLSVVHDPDTGETVLRGQGEMHLGAALERLATVHNVSVTTRAPRTAYRETIRQPVRQHSRLKRQTGGHGQFADVDLEVEPLPRGTGFRFESRVVGGVVPKQYVPAVGDAAREAMRHGPFGYPVVDVSVALVGGGYHDVDSSEMAFRSATRSGLATALTRAEPVLLEPIARVSVYVPDAYTANAQRLLTSHRGQILGYAARENWPGWDEVQALVPEAELSRFIIELRSQTMGQGTFLHSFDHLEEAPHRVSEAVAARAAAAG